MAGLLGDAAGLVQGRGLLCVRVKCTHWREVYRAEQYRSWKQMSSAVLERLVRIERLPARNEALLLQYHFPFVSPIRLSPPTAMGDNAREYLGGISLAEFQLPWQCSSGEKSIA